jgi:protoporphyrinogen oxidase
VTAQRWCVVGGGMLGLSLARRLALSGKTVEVWEAAEQLGGLAAPWKLGDVEWDRFYHVITSNDTFLRDLLKTLELERDICWKRVQTGFCTGGRLHSFSGLLDFAFFPPLNPVDKFRLGTTILRAARITDYRPLEQLTAVEWLTQLSGQKVVDRIWLPLLRAKLGCNAERVNAAFIWAIITRMYGARKGSGKTELFGYVPGGYRRILDRLVTRLEDLGIALYPSRPVTRITVESDGHVKVSDGSVTEEFDRVVVTVPAPAAAEMLPDLVPMERNRLLNVEYQGVICASVLLSEPLTPYYITNITDPAPFTAVIEMDALVDRSELGGHGLVYLPKYVPSNDSAFDRDDDGLRREFIAGLNWIHPKFGMKDVIDFRIARARYVLPISTIGYSDRVPSFTTTLRNVYVVNSTQIVNGTLNVNQTLELSDRAFACMSEHSDEPAEHRTSSFISKQLVL